MKAVADTPPFVPKPYSKNTRLYDLGRNFKTNPMFSKFQEIEMISGERYDHRKENLLDWISRICKI